MEPTETTQTDETVTVTRVRSRGRSLVIAITKQARDLGIEVGDDIEVRIRRLGP